MSYIQQKSHYKTLFIITVFLLFITIIFSSASGIANISFTQTFKIILCKIPFVKNLVSTDCVSNTQSLIILNIRLPRILLSSLIGAGLSVVGVSFQAIFKNPMADPYILGISSGAALGASISIIMGFSISFLGLGITAIFSFIGALLTTFIVYTIAKVGNKLPVNTLLLSGVAVSFLFSSLISIIIIFNRKQVEQIVFWTMGSVSSANWKQVLILFPVVAIGIILIFILSKDLNILLTGTETALSLGINVEMVKKIILIVSSIIIAACVSVSGIIGFVGIIIPHALRFIVGPDHRVLIPFTAISGSIFMIISDTLARTLAAPTEMPVGAITALFGAPYFIYLLIKKKRKVR